EGANLKRRQLCSQIEAEAIHLIETSATQTLAPWHERGDWVIVIVHPDWHHGVIGIVASRLVERYGLPVFIGTYEDVEQTQIRGSARGIPEFDVFAALQACADLWERFGGHRAAGGFSMAAANLGAVRSRLRDFAHHHLALDQLKPLITIDAQAEFDHLTPELFQQIDQLHPCGIGNPEPLFWTPSVQVLEQRVIGKEKDHLKLTLASPSAELLPPKELIFKAIGWRWAIYYPLPPRVDIAYRLRENTWNQQTTLELELLGVRPATKGPPPHILLTSPDSLSHPSPSSASLPQQVNQKALNTKTVTIKEHPQHPPFPEEPSLTCPQPSLSPTKLASIDWLPLDDWPDLVARLQGHLLIYGYQRPYISQQKVAGSLDYDRPSQTCDVFILWSLPPSWTHLRWLLKVGQPQRVYVRNQTLPLPAAQELRSRLKFNLAKNSNQPLNLLDLGQQWWIAPSTVIAALRSIGYSCSTFPPTESVEQELERLQRWYLCTAQKLATLT
ncbi:MAG: single-stranded-DNA-specific exonuclease RecJ, partial [Acaryochloridaceae cyanobacterium SU_2_1]|nr:single-stranded-DNA-specific exonuclease RecJ [Acaryochloridaceae cyanobacterium SU_2_1]